MKNKSASSSTIAILLPDLKIGGTEKTCLALAKQLSVEGFKVEFVLMRNQGRLLREVPAQITVTSLNVNRFRNLIIPLVVYLRRTRPDSILVAMWPLTSIALWAQRIARTRTCIVVSDHSILSKSPQAMGAVNSLIMKITMRLSYPLADSVVAVSKGVARDISKLSWLPRERIVVINNPAARGSLPATKLQDERVAVWLRSEAKIISVGNLKPVKDQATLVRAIAKIPDGLKASLLILGEGQERVNIERLVTELGLTNKVILLGEVSDPYPYYLAADLFVLSSKYEGFGNVLVEAMECGLPVVSTDCESGPREILDNGKYGRLVPVNDPDSLASAIIKALDSNHNPEQLRARAGEFGVKVASDAYMKLMDLDNQVVP